MIPEEKSEAVALALAEAFGTSQFDDLRMLSKSRTALVFRIVVGGRPYLLRIIEHIGDANCECQFTSMRAAAEAGLAPHVWYTSLEDRICITNFIEAVPLAQEEALVLMPAVLRTLHALRSFPGREAHFNTSCTFLLANGPHLERLIQPFRAANLLPEGDTERLFDWYASIAAVYPHDDSMVSSHNDLVRPSNILFDGKQVWLIDWEAAFLNDRYAELAVVANFVASDRDEEMTFLQRYFGRSPDAYELARFFLMQQIAHMFYAMVYLLLGSAGKPVDWTEAPPDFREFHRRAWNGTIDFEDRQMKIAYGKVHWQQLVCNTKQPRFTEALGIVAEGHRTQ